MKEASQLEKKFSDADKLGPSLQFSRKMDKETGKEGSLEFKLSDGTAFTSENIDEAYKRTTGTSDIHYGVAILSHIANGLQGGDKLEKLTRAANMLPALRPQDETEAMLMGQFLSLQEAGNNYLRLAGIQDGFYHLERYVILANKLFNTANQTMQTLVKYRCRGQQVVQVVHVHNEGQAIVAQNLSHSGEVRGSTEKI